MTEERVYTINDPEIILQTQRDYLAKVYGNKAAGLKAFRTGEFTPFRGWSEETSLRTFDTILELDDASQQRIQERVVNPLQKLAEKHDITAIYPGSGDLPSHVVLQPGRFTNLGPEYIKAIQDWLLSDKSHLTWLSRLLEGLTFHLDTLVVAPNSFICASLFDIEQGGAFKARKAIERMMRRALTKTEAESAGSFSPPFSYYDIFHSSVMRLTEKASIENLLAFGQEAYITIGEDLRKNPASVTVKNLYRGRATDFHRKHAPKLILP